MQQYKNDGQFVYELYAILIHAGGAHAGHYYGYIKDNGKLLYKSILFVLITKYRIE